MDTDDEGLTSLQSELDQITREGIANGTIPSAIVDSGTTSNVGMPNYPFLDTNKISNKEFSVANGQVEKATVEKLLHHEVREPARTVDIVPGISTAMLVSTSKFADANYFTIFDDEEVNIYDANNTEITVSRGAILKGWRDNKSGLWRIPLVPVVKNINTDTIVCNKPPSELLQHRPPPAEAIHNIYELKSQAETIRYLHAAAGFPTKSTWINAIEKGFYASWPGLTAKSVRKHFPESVETQKGHMKKQKAGIRSTKKEAKPTKKVKDVLVKVYDVHDEVTAKIYTDQTRKRQNYY